MTPEGQPDAAWLAALCARAYRHMQPWSAAAFAETLARPETILMQDGPSFVLGRVIADEAEILALATDPDAQRRGAASRALRAFLDRAQDAGAVRVFLEVAAANAPALAFYDAHAFTAAGRRANYYRLPDGTAGDALILQRALP